MHARDIDVSSNQPAMTSSSIALRRYVERALLEPQLELEIGMDMRITPQMFRRLVKALRSQVGPGEDTLQMDVEHRSETRARDARLEFRGRELVEAALASSAKGSSIGPASVAPSRVLVKNRETPTITHEEYDYKIKLKRELDVTDEEAGVTRAMAPGAHFRLKRRFSFLVGVCRVDCTVVQERLHGDATSVYLPFKYEVEVEFVDREGSKGDPDFVVDELTRVAQECVRVMIGCSKPPSRQERKAVFEALAVAATSASESPDEHRNASVPPAADSSAPENQTGGGSRPIERLSGPQPVTLLRRHVAPPSTTPALAPVPDQVSGSVDFGLETIWLGGYTVTDKADGLRCQLIVLDGVAYTIDSGAVVRRCVESLPSSLDGTWIDGELITSGPGGSDVNSFAAFDIYMAGARPAAALPLMTPPNSGRERASRIAHLQKAVASLSRGVALDGFDAWVKQFRLVDQAGNAARAALDVARTQRDYETDGLIFTPAYLPVGARHAGDPVHINGVWPQTLKWKEPQQNTIDFLVRSVNDGTGDPGVVSDADGVPGRLFDVFASYNPKEWEPVDVTKFIQFGDRAFPSGIPRPRRFNVGGSDAARMHVPLDAAGRPVCEDGEPVYSDTIVECAMENDRWKPLRVRPEKTARLVEDGIARAANNWGTALGVWHSIVEPVTVSMIERLEDVPPDTAPGVGSIHTYYSARTFGRERSVLSKMVTFHNTVIKAHLYREAASGCSAVGDAALFEMACGKGGDMNRWLENKYSPVVGIDLSLDNIVNAEDGVYARMKGRSTKNRTMVFVQMDAATRMRPPLDDIRYVASGSPHGEVISALWDASTRPLTSTAFTPLRGIVQSGFDVVSCQFAVHYLFENDLVLDRFVSNVDFLLRPGGVFIGTCFDGDRLARELESAPNGRLAGVIGGHRAWEIVRRYEHPFSGSTGAAIDVFVETINQTVTEYLVSPRLLKSRFEAVGLSTWFMKPFSDMFVHENGSTIAMSDVERQLSSKYMMFAFRRAAQGDVDAS